MKTVKRTYYSKSVGGMVTKTYTYDYYSRRGGKNPTLVSKSGKIYKDRVNDLIDNVQDPAMRADIRAIVSQARRTKDKLTTTGLAAKLTDDKYEKMLINAGYSKEQFEKETGIKFSEFSKKENWKSDDMGQWSITVRGRTYKYKHSYDRSILSEV